MSNEKNLSLIIYKKKDINFENTGDTLIKNQNYMHKCCLIIHCCCLIIFFSQLLFKQI